MLFVMMALNGFCKMHARKLTKEHFDVVLQKTETLHRSGFSNPRYLNA